MLRRSCGAAGPRRRAPSSDRPSTGSWSLVRPKDPFEAKEVTVQPGTVDTQEQTAKNGDAKSADPDVQVGDKQKAPEGTGPPAKRWQAEQRAIPTGLTLKTVPGDGNCLFSSFALAYAAATGKDTPPHHPSASSRSDSALSQASGDLQCALGSRVARRAAGASFEEYIEAVARPTTWCGLLEIRALSRMYGCRVTVVPRATTEPVFSVKPSQKQRIVVLLFTGIHFDALLPEAGKPLPKQIKEVVTEPPKVPMRGGGGSRCTVWTDDSCSRRSSGKRSRQTVWTVAQAPSKRQASAAPSCAAASAAELQGRSAEVKEQDLEALVQVCAAKPKRRPGRPAICQWVQDGFARCRLCPFRVQAADPRTAQLALASHFQGHHKGHTPTGAQNFNQQLPSVVTLLSVDQDCVWKCKFCSMGISVEAARSAGDVRIPTSSAPLKAHGAPLSWPSLRRPSERLSRLLRRSPDPNAHFERCP